ncbi:SNW domain-containing protein 1 [Cimex lectularius]|uniref:SKI-interacting protein SKIP SNW domain-containing protein n=1 Tax=Cimex lectularius TaxID=79782 RepID=A0A8I6S6S7_CIMLE|nr:SNW domain-containing protein 1 [Cimex lectularius]
MSLSTLLPAPTQPIWDIEDEAKTTWQATSTALVSTSPAAPPYGQRRGWVPRTLEDYGDGGAFPEIPMAQYPLNMGLEKKESSSNALAVQLDAQGKIKYDVIARQGHSKDKIIYSKLTDLLPSEIKGENDPSLAKPDEETIQETTERTRLALEKITSSKIASAMPVRCAEKAPPAQFIRYTPAQQGSSFNSGAKQRVIRMVEAQKDPLEPPKFKINKKIPRGPPSPPAPVLHSPTRKVTVKEQKEWKIPPCISNWKNAKGYTIPLDKRLAADGRGLQQVHINENFSKLAEALYIADRKAREAVEMRAQLEKKLAQKEKEKKEEHLRQLAQKAREERAGIRTLGHEKDEEARERDQLRFERHKDRARERNLARAAPEKRSKLERDRERDISEQIALGMPAKSQPLTGEAAFDQRLFNTTKGMDSGFGDDESYNVYDKPWRDGNSLANHLYRPGKNVDKEIYGDDLEKIMKTNRFVPDKEFSGTDRAGGGRSSGPVQFEKDEEDPFGLDQFLTQAKRGGNQGSSKRMAPKEDKRDDKRRRRD